MNSSGPGRQSKHWQRNEQENQYLEADAGSRLMLWLHRFSYSWHGLAHKTLVMCPKWEWDNRRMSFP